MFTGANQNAQDLYKQILPIFQKEATNPQGFAPADLAAMNTASQQSVGGATAGAVGEGNLAAARTRNSGGYTPALDEAVRSGQRQLSTNALDTQTKNALLKESQKQSGISGLGGLYGQNSQQLLQALGLGNQSTQALTEAGKSGWFQNMLGLITALKPGGSVGGGQPAQIGIGGG